MIGWWLVAGAMAVTPELVIQRAHDAEAFRAARLDHDAPSHAPEIYQRVLDHGVQTGLVDVQGETAKKAWGVGIFEVPIGRYWAAISDDLGKIEYTRLAYAEVFEGTRCQSPRRVFQYVPIPLLSDRWWVADMLANGAINTDSRGRVREQTWATNGDFTVKTPEARAWAKQGIHPVGTRGSWWLVDLDGESTLVEYNSWSDPGGSIPAGMASSFAVRGIGNTLQNMADAAREGLSACPVW